MIRAWRAFSLRCVELAPASDSSSNSPRYCAPSRSQSSPAKGAAQASNATKLPAQAAKSALPAYASARPARPGGSPFRKGRTRGSQGRICFDLSANSGTTNCRLIMPRIISTNVISRVRRFESSFSIQKPMQRSMRIFTNAKRRSTANAAGRSSGRTLATPATIASRNVTAAIAIGSASP